MLFYPVLSGERAYDLNEMVMIHGVKPNRMLETAFERRVPVSMSFLFDHRWHVVRAVIADISEGSFNLRVTPKKKAHSAGVKTGDMVGVSFKYGYGGNYDKFVFDTVVTDTGRSAATRGTVTLAIPQQIELVPRRSYRRVCLPQSLDVNVRFSHRYCVSDGQRTFVGSGPDWEGRLIDISAGGMQIVIGAAPKHDFSRGQFVNLRFAPMPCETDLVFNAGIRSILPTADGGRVCFGLQIVGLEASPEGRLILSRLVGVVEQYHQMNKSQDSGGK